MWYYILQQYYEMMPGPATGTVHIFGGYMLLQQYYKVVQFLQNGTV
jgi:hypothetical protein